MGDYVAVGFDSGSSVFRTGKQSSVASEHFRNNNSALMGCKQAGQAIRAKMRWIAGGTLLCGLLGALYGFTLFQESYQSSAKILLDVSDTTPTRSGETKPNQLLTGSGFESSPYKTQEELLKSQLIFNRVAEKLKQEKIRLPYRKPEDLAGTIFNAEHIDSTSFIRLTAKAHQPKLAQKLTQLYLDAYTELMGELANMPIQRKKQLFEEQVRHTETELAGINRKIEAYRHQYGILELNVESRDRLQRLVYLDTERQTAQIDLSQKQAEANRIRKQLKLKKGELEKAMQAVVRGQDNTLTRLREQQQELQTDYNAKALIYAPTNPDMIRLQGQLDSLSKQITDQQILTVGHVAHAQSDFIKDSVRANLVNRLAIADAEAAALQHRAGSLRAQANEMRNTLKNLPKHQLEYARLMMDQKNREDLLTRLKDNLAETRIEEATAGKKLMVIDQPGLPDQPLAPLRWQLALGAGLAGFLLCASAVAGHAMLTRRNLRPELIEQALDTPVLGDIPWVSEEKWRYLRSRSRLEVSATDTDPAIIKAYQDLALNLKVRRNTLHQNTVVLSQTFDEKGHAVILANLAFCLAQGGDRVLLIDADLRNPGVHEAFNHNLDYERSLPELINSVSELLHRKKDTQVQDVLQLVSAVATPSGLHPQLEYLNAGLQLKNTFEFLNAKSFDVLLNVVKAGYDWVLVSAPPVMSYPDCTVLLGYVDGLILLSDQQTELSHLIAAHRKVERIGSGLYGVILRNSQG